jgi:hypothetical protein
MGVDCETDLYMVVHKVRERLVAIKRPMQRFYSDRFSLKYIVACALKPEIVQSQ